MRPKTRRAVRRPKLNMSIAARNRAPTYVKNVRPCYLVSVIKIMGKPKANWTWKEDAEKKIAQFSGATLGFIHKNVRGAKIGWDAAGKLYDWQRARQDSGHAPTPQKRQKTIGMNLAKKKMTNATNMLVDQSSMKKIGKTRVKRIKKIKISKKLTQSIKQVVAGEQAKGSYTRVYTGYVGQLMNVNSTGFPRAGFNTTTLGAAQNAVYGPNYQEPAGQRTLWGTLAQATPTATTFAAGNLTTGAEFNYFTIRKIIDAASICFNRKTPVIGSAEVLTDNLTTIYNPTDGTPYSNTGALKIQVNNSFVQFTIRNVSQRSVYFDVYECTPTLKFQDSTALQSLINSLETTGQNAADVSGTVDSTVKYNNLLTAAGSAQNPGIVLDGTVDAVDLAKQFGFNFKITKRQMVLAPYETCVHSIKGPSGLLDFAKLQADASQKLNLLKGWSVSCIFSVRGDQLLATTTNSVSRFTKIGAVPSPGGGNYFSTSIVVEVKESISCSVPEVAGFLTQAAAVGTRQMLNFRKKKIVYSNYIPANGDSSGAAFVGSNENNPAASISIY